MPDNYSKSRIAKNSAVLYLRMLFTMWINLWATRLVLANLGVEDMGVYGVVGSVVSLFAVISGGVSTAIQRFITFEMGREDGNLNGVFCASLNVVFFISVALVILLEVCGLWFLHHKVDIPAESMNAATWAFHLSVCTCVVNLNITPYNALIVAHERMDAFAVISILQVVLNCAAAYCLCYLDNRLFCYALLIALTAVVIRMVYQFYCRKEFPESKYKFRFDKQLTAKLLRFSCVSSLSGALQVVYSQGVTFVINWTFGVALNAVYLIAMQLKNAIMSFAQNINKAIAPQITKTYASGESEAHKTLVYMGSKLEVYMIYFIMIPFLFQAPYIMHLWLGNVPPYAVEFAQCTLFLSLTYTVIEPIHSAVLATGHIGRVLIIPNALTLLAIPVGYAIGLHTSNPAWLIVSVVAIEIMACMLRIYYAFKVTCLDAKGLWSHVAQPCVLVAAASTLVCFVCSQFLGSNLLSLILLLLINSLALCTSIFVFGMNRHERGKICSYMLRLKNNVKYKVS